MANQHVVPNGVMDGEFGLRVHLALLQGQKHKLKPLISREKSLETKEVNCLSMVEMDSFVRRTVMVMTHIHREAN